MRLTPRVLHLSAKVVLGNLTGQGFEPEVPFLKYVVAPTDTCLHVGASDGRHTFVMSRLTPQGKVVAFEPSAFSYAVLCNVVAAHRLANVQTFNLAVADADEDITLTTPVKPNGNLGRSFSMIDRAPETGIKRSDIAMIGERHQKVHCIALDGFCAAHGIAHVDFIRCDVEGAEARVLAGGQAMLARCLPNILVELHPMALQTAFGTTAEAVRDGLLAMGYRMFHVNAGRLVASEAIIPGTWSDYFFVHPSRVRALPEGPFRAAMLPVAVG